MLDHGVSEPTAVVNHGTVTLLSGTETVTNSRPSCRFYRQMDHMGIAYYLSSPSQFRSIVNTERSSMLVPNCSAPESQATPLVRPRPQDENPWRILERHKLLKGPIWIDQYSGQFFLQKSLVFRIIMKRSSLGFRHCLAVWRWSSN